MEESDKGTARPSTDGPVVMPGRIEAVLFDLDGVITDTARAHAAAWKRAIDLFLERREARQGEDLRPFDDGLDYERYVDGKRRLDGVRSFLESREIKLPEGEPDDDLGAETVNGIGNAKTALFLDQIDAEGVDPFPDTVALLGRLRDLGIDYAVFSGSSNCRRILGAAGLIEMFDVVVDGQDASSLGLAGKPDPAMLEEAARRLRVEKQRAAVIEDSLAGVEAGRRGGFGLVVGVDRRGSNRALAEGGADVVVEDLRRLEPPSPSI